MIEREGVNYTELTAELLVCNEPCLLWGVVILASSDGGRVKIYDGRDATSGRLVLYVKGFDNNSNPIMLPKPAFLAGGLFVTDFSHIDSVTVLWERAEKKG